MRLLIVDDHPVVLAGCRAIFSECSDIETVGASDGLEAVEAFFEQRIDIALIDIGLPDISGFEVIRRIRRRRRGARLLVFDTSADFAHALYSAEIGASGYITKCDDPTQIRERLRIVAAGENNFAEIFGNAREFLPTRSGSILTPREAVILRLLGSGEDMTTIARRLNLPYHRIAANCATLRKKLGLNAPPRSFARRCRESIALELACSRRKMQPHTAIYPAVGRRFWVGGTIPGGGSAAVASPSLSFAAASKEDPPRTGGVALTRSTRQG